jgi:hypothetical protein
VVGTKLVQKVNVKQGFPLVGSRVGGDFHQILANALAAEWRRKANKENAEK